MSSCFTADCPAGSYSTQTRTCSVCPLGTYQPSSGQPSCIPCGKNLTTISNGTVEEMHCVGKFTEKCYNLDWNRLSCDTCCFKHPWLRDLRRLLAHTICPYQFMDANTEVSLLYRASLTVSSEDFATEFSLLYKASATISSEDFAIQSGTMPFCMNGCTKISKQR